MYVIAGLGNPDRKYENTRHNVGFDVIDLLSEKYGIPVNTPKHKCLIGKGIIEGMEIMLVKPQTYMNLSGTGIRAVMEYYHEPVQNLVVLCDDVYLDIGVLRVRKKGSAGGHNGLKNIILELGTDEFARVRIGVGKQPEKMDLVAFVLSHFSKAERADLEDTYPDAAKAAVSVLKDGADKAMNLYNGNRLNRQE